MALIEAGLPARNLTGGMCGWQKAGLPLESADGAPGSVDFAAEYQRG